MATVEFRPHRLEGGISEILLGMVSEQDHAVGVQRIERMLDLPNSAFDVGQRQRREVAEAIGPPGDKIFAVVA